MGRVVLARVAPDRPVRVSGSGCVVRGDAVALPLADSSVDLVVTSPPYFALRSYQDEGGHYEGQIGSEPTPTAFLEALWTVTRELVRVLKPSGSIFVNLGDKYAGSGGHNNNGLGKSTLVGTPSVRDPAARTVGVKASRRNAPDRYAQATIGGARPKSLMGLPWRYALGCVDDLGLILRAELLWSKPNSLPESVTDRVRRTHEQWFHFVKEGRYFAAVDEIREPYSAATVARYASPTSTFSERTENVMTERYGGELVDVNPLGRLPASVWSIATEPLKVPAWAREKFGLPDHFAAFPTEWPRRLILGWSPSGICSACGEGRRPLVEKTNEVVATSTRSRSWNLPDDDGLRESGLAGRERVDTTQDVRIVGYVCSCKPSEIPAATTPAVVLDPFGGTGTVALVARELGRTGVSLDLSQDYSRLARWRIEQSGHAVRARERTWKERQGGLGIR